MTEEERKRLLSQINIISKDDTSNEANQIRARVNQQDQNFFADVGRVFEATGAGISSTLSNLGKGALLAGRDLGGASDFADKITNEMRNKSDAELEDIAKKNNISTTTLKDYINKSKTSYENINDFSANTFDKWANEANQRVQELQAETDNPFTKEVIGFMPNLSQQAVNVGVSFINPALVPYVAGLEAKGSYYNDAKQRGMTDEQANDFSTAMAGVEAFTEKLTVKDVKAGITKIGEVKSLLKGGIKGATKEATQEAVKETTKSGIKEAFKSLAKGMGENAFQEGVTEIIQEAFADAITKKDLGQSFYDFLNQQDNWEDIWGRVFKSAVGGALSAGITGGVGMGVSSCVSVNNKIQNGEQVTQQEILQANQDAIEKSKTLPKEQQEQFNEQITQGSEIGIQNVINQVETEQNQPQNEQKSAVPMQTNEKAQQQVQEQEQQVISNQDKNTLNQNVEPQNLVESAERSGIDVKDEKTRKNLETIQKFNENRGVKATFDADAFKGHDNVNSFFRTDENGNREIVFNPNTMTDKTIQQLAVHEVYHDMVAGGTAQELTDFVVQKMSNNPEYQEYVRALQDVYGEQDSDIIKEEAVAHYLEKNLGTNEFISELQERGDRTTIQRIIDTIKDMITKAKNTLTGKGDLNYLLDLQRKYEQAYRGEFKGTQEQTKLSKQVNEYQGSHQIDTENSTSLNNLDLNDIESKVKQVNGALSKQDISDLNKLKKLKDNDTITIYRASPVNELNNGDWVTTDKSYAQNVAKENGGKVYSYEVNANELLYPNNVKDLPSLHRLSSFQYNSQDNIQENTISNQPTTDNQGRTLTKEQQDYFKDSKVRDENGNLETFYHGANQQFNTFNSTRKPIYGNKNVNFFTNNENVAKSYGGEVYETYINSKSPYILNGDTDGTTLEYSKTGKEELTQNSDIIKAIRQKLDENGSRYYKKSVSKISENILDNNKNILSNEEIQYLTEHPLSLAYLSVKAKDGFAPYSKSVNTNDLVNAVLSINEKTNNKYDGVIFKSIQDAGQNFDNNAFTKNDVIATFEPNQIKNVDNTNPTENVDIRYSKEAPTKDNQGRELSKGQQERYKDISPKLKDENGNIKTYYHGTQRADRVGTIFDPNKATSGPMAFFTDNPEVAQSYSKNKSDTSLSRDYDREWDLFKANNNNLDTYWRLLSENKKNEIRQKGYEAGLDEDYNVAFGKDMSKNSFGNEYEYLLKRNNNNAIKALYEIYVNSGNLWQEEIRQFKDVLDYVGVENTSYLDPYKTDSKVYETYLNIKNPFDTSEISQEMVDKLEEASKKVDYNADEAYYADMWDKTSIEPSEWIDGLKEDIKDGTTYSWTRIPDWVTDVLKSEGYDGIVDTGGKHGGQEHQVAIPFYSDQIKNVTNVNPTDNPDINLSKQGTGTSQDIINNFLENTKVNEGTGTKIKDLARVPIQQETQVETKTKEAPVSQETTQDYLTHHPDYYDGDQFDFNAHRTEVINKANQDIVDIIKNSSNLREDLQRAYDLNEKNDVVDIKTGQDEDNRLTYQQKETILSSLLRSKDIENSDLYKSLMEDTTPRQVAPSEAPAQVPQVNEVKQRQVEPIRDITDVERPQIPQNQKVRKTYESIINSNQMTQEAKQIAKELMGYDTYVPQTNEFTLAVADRNIKQNGVDESLTTLTNKINNNDRVNAVDIATGERLIEYYSKIGDREKLQEAIQTTAMAGTEAGRAVQAMSMISHQTPIGQVTWIQRSVDKVNKRLAKEGRKAQFNFTPEMQQKILNSTSENLQQNLNEVYQELGKQVPKSNMEKFNEWRYFSMLANPKTHFRNILGNLVMAQVQRAKNKVAGTIEDFVIGDNAERWNSLKGASKGMYEFAKNDLKNADVQSMLGLNENKYNPQSRLQQNQRTFKRDLLENTLGKLFNLNSKALEAEDGWGLKSGYAKAMANYLNANNLDYNNLTDAQLQKARNYAVQQAKEATFHQENTVANVLQTWENKNLFTKVALGGAIPFKKTPMNVALTGFEYSPAGFAKTLTTDLVNLRKGKISANQFIDNISKNLTGTAISLLGYGLTQAGILKASGSGDEDKDEFEEATGKQNYSIQIGDKTYSLDWLTPAGIPLFIGSELYQVSHQKEDGNKTKNENEAFKSITKILDATASAMNPMSEMTMISGLTNALKSYAQGSTKSIENMLANVGKSYATQAVPTALGQIARSTDEYERSTTSTETDPMAKAIDSAKNQIISKIPGLRETLPISTDVWGNERETQSYEENAILPWTSKEISKDPVNKALTDLYDATGESGVLPDNYIDKSLTIDKEKYKLTNEEYVRLKQQYGKTAHDILADLTKSKEYEQMSDEQKVKAVKEAYSYAKSTLKVTYSDENNLDAEESSTYKKVQSVIDNGGDAKEYFEYTGLIDGVKKEKEKRQILLNSNIKDKGAIYESTIGSDDETYQIMKATGIDPDAYLEYKQQDFSSDKEDDGTVKGKTVSGSGKTKFYDYMDNANMTYEQKLLLTGMKYKLLPGERDTLANYIDTLPISASEKTDIYKKLKGATVYQNGEIYY